MSNNRLSNKEFQEVFKKRLLFFLLQLVRFAQDLPWQNPVLKVAQGQVIRSGTSMGANYFESTAGSTTMDFINFNNYALKSANETVFWLVFLQEYFGEQGQSDQLLWLLKEAQELARMFASIVIGSKKKKNIDIGKEKS